MRKIKVERGTNSNHLFITDWNHKKWHLQRVTNGLFECEELKGALFAGEHEFMSKMYGLSEIMSEYSNSVVFVNYEIESINN